MVKCTHSSDVITAQHSPTKTCRAKNDLINILLLLTPSICSIQMHHGLPGETRVSFPLRLTLQGFWAPSISVRAFHYKLLLPQSTTDFFLIYRSQLTRHHSDCFRASGRPSAKKKKIDFCSSVVEVKRYYVPVTAGCAASRSEQRLRPVNNTNKPEDQSWIQEQNAKQETKDRKHDDVPLKIASLWLFSHRIQTWQLTVTTPVKTQTADAHDDSQAL